MTEPHLRELFAWIEAKRAADIDLAGELAEIAAAIRGIDLRDDGAPARIANMIQLKAMAVAAGLSELERIHPAKPDEDEITAVGLSVDPDADTKPGVPPPKTPRRFTGRRVK
ncbi:MAG TPA: hypothetical protein VJP45_04605 [Candidatus Limnocylindria bacterium]|nr:hypothetical protein [Candidatus Limnocylindria bacterium]